MNLNYIATSQLHNNPVDFSADKYTDKTISNKKKVIYPHGLIERIGHLACEVFFLRNLYDENEYEITVVTYPPRLMPRTNKAVYDIVLRGLNVEHSTDSKFMWINHSRAKDYSVVIDKDVLYEFTRLDNFNIKFWEKFQHKNPFFYFSLSDSDIEKGRKMLNKYNIPESAPIITLHVREGGYLQDDNHSSHRNLSIENYIPAINYLINEGFYIVRIGDKSMKRFVNPPPQLIDAPFHPEYTDFVEPYFTAVSKFFIGCGSGPADFAQSFGVPVLRVNNVVQAAMWGVEKCLCVPQKIYSHRIERYLTYEEFILSPAVNFYEDQLIQQAGIEYRENSPEEILMAVKEMNARLDGVYSMPQEEITKINQRVKTIQSKAHFYRKCTINPDVWASYPVYAPYLSKMQMSMEFIKMNPDFLGHEWPV